MRVSSVRKRAFRLLLEILKDRLEYLKEGIVDFFYGAACSFHVEIFPDVEIVPRCYVRWKECIIRRLEYFLKVVRLFPVSV